MMKATDLKRLLKTRFGVSCRVHSSKHYVNAWVPSTSGHVLTYDSPPFPLDFRQKCLRVIYGQDCTFAENGNAGNVREYGIAYLR